jgi:hypothetical protein
MLKIKEPRDDNAWDLRAPSLMLSKEANLFKGYIVAKAIESHRCKIMAIPTISKQGQVCLDIKCHFLTSIRSSGSLDF